MAVKTILITGGTGGLGSFATSLIVQNGYQAVVPYRSDEQAERLRASLSQESLKRLILVKVDALKVEGVHAMYALIDTMAEPLYGLVHLLGGVKSFRAVCETSVEDWDALLSLNLRSYFLFAKEAMLRFQTTHEGRIISMGAMSAIKPAAKQSSYSVAKSGVVALTKILADEGREIGVTANCIAPGVIVTKANLEWGSSEDAKKWVTPEEVAHMIVYLLSEAACSVNGTVIQMFGKMNV